MTPPAAAPPPAAANPPAGIAPDPPGEAAVRCDNVLHLYRVDDLEVVALRGVDLTVAQGETLALLGPSGAGKSTLLWLLAGLLRPSAGSLRVFGRDVGKLPARELARLRATEIGVVLQNPARNLLPYATAAQNLAFAGRSARRGGRPVEGRPRERGRPVEGRPRERGRQARRRYAELLEAVGLAGLASRRAGALSGGEQQRLAVAMALARRPRLLLADEPTSQLDADSAGAVVDLLRWAGDDGGAAVVVVTHDPAVSRAFGRTLTIRDGRVGTQGRGGEDFLVVGRDGGVQLPPEAQQALPPGSLARIRIRPYGVELHRAGPDEAAEADRSGAGEPGEPGGAG